MMKNKISFKIVLIAIIILIFPTNAMAYWGASYDKAATVTAHVEPTGGGKVYTAVEASDFSDPKTSDWKTSTSQGGNSSNTRGASLPVFIYAQANNGYEFLGWSETSSGTLFGSSDYVDSYTSDNIHGIKKNYTAYSGTGDGEIKYDVYARFNPLPYNITYVPGERGTGTTQTQDDVTITTDITLKSGTIFTPDNGYEFKEWKVTSLGSTNEKWALNQTYNSSNLHIRTGYYSENVTLTAQWQAKRYEITYVPGSGASVPSGNTQYYYIDRSGADDKLRTPTKTGSTFSGWKVTVVDSEGNWTLNQTLSAGTPLIGKYGDVTLTALWDLVLCPITISLSGMDPGVSGIFTVSKDGAVLYTVAVASGSSVTIKDVESGTYKVTPTSWSWAYTGLSEQSSEVTDPVNGHTFAFTASKNTTKKHAEESRVNWKP